MRFIYPRAQHEEARHGCSRQAEPDSRHQCLIYDGSPSLQLPALAAMICRKMSAGYQCLYLNSQPMVAGMRSCLAATGMDVEGEVARGSLILSAESTLAADGSFDVELMLSKLEAALDGALSAGYTGLWASGDMTWEFGAEKNFAKLLEYEYQLEELMNRRPELSGVCQYHQDTLPAGTSAQALSTHRTLFVNESLTRHNPLYVPRTSSGGHHAA
ncbi:MAG TPA: MEDS domain-containing protein [Prosthecobacter sp.]|nr:MEDS domain-containing protein [Prosthecobacter sp.]